MNTWGDKCCPTGCGKAEGRSADEETFMKESATGDHSNLKSIRSQ